MRHNRKDNHLGRTHSHRYSLLSNLAASLILHKRINTTVAKAKALRIYVEPIITRSKNDSTHSRRMVFRYLQNKSAVSELFREIAPRITDRPGGYTRIIKLGNRPGDNAEMCMMELVDFNALLAGGKEGAGAAKKTTRRGGTRKKATATTSKAEKAAEGSTEEAAPKKKATRSKAAKKEDKGE